MTEFFADEAAAQAALALSPGQLGSQSTPAPEPATEPEPQQAPPGEEEIPEFDERWREPFTGLLFVGALTDTFSLFGHTFRVSTPDQTEMLQIGQVIDPYARTVTSELAYATATVAAYLIEVDGRPLPQPIFTDVKDTALQNRFDWVIKNIKREVIQEIFNKCLELDSKVAKVLEAMGKASG